ncbi:MAG TPA: glycosyltransferase [Planctomycetes bacterium]|nr:glycosyltransferase [Planctomycetota bacterium]
MPKASVSLIIPVYQSAHFLEDSVGRCVAWLDGLPEDTELLLIDDASKDGSWELMKNLVEKHRGCKTRLRALRNLENRGKGFSVRRGMLLAEGDFRIFTDADLTYPVEDAANLLRALQDGADVAIGSRMHPDSRYIVAPDFLRYIYSRHLFGRIFNLLVRILVVPGIYDTQAGLKGVRKEVAPDLFPRGRLQRFSFDVEFLFLARLLGYRIQQCPLQFYYRKEPSTVHFVRDSFRMLMDMLRIRWRSFRGRYRTPTPPQAILDDPACGPEFPAAPEGTGERSVEL